MTRTSTFSGLNFNSQSWPNKITLEPLQQWHLRRSTGLIPNFLVNMNHLHTKKKEMQGPGFEKTGFPLKVLEAFIPNLNLMWHEQVIQPHHDPFLYLNRCSLLHK